MMHKVSNTTLVAQLVIAQAQVVTTLHHVRTMPDHTRQACQDATLRKVEELEAFRARLLPHIPSVAKLNGWYRVRHD